MQDFGACVQYREHEHFEYDKYDYKRQLAMHD